jgi:AAA domain
MTPAVVALGLDVDENSLGVECEVQVVDPSSDIHHETMSGTDVGPTAGPAPERGACPSDTPPKGAGDDVGCRTAIVPSPQLLARVRERIGDPRDAQLWGLHVRARAVTMLVGETSAGKTVFLHNLGYHLASGREFLGIAPPRRVRILHLDFESYAEILEEHLAAIGTTDGWDFVDTELMLEAVARGPKLVEHIGKIVQAEKYDLVIVDSLLEAYPVQNENDNAEAQIQMLKFRQLARATGAAVVLAHNSGLRGSRKTKRGKQNVATDKFFGRGATTRSDKVDVSINFTAPADAERLLFVSKSRAANFGQSIRVGFSGQYSYQLLEEGGSREAGMIKDLQGRSVALVREQLARGTLPVPRKVLGSSWK